MKSSPYDFALIASIVAAGLASMEDNASWRIGVAALLMWALALWAMWRIYRDS